jgi:ribosomal protein S18 acetylase RimI-like enzyme
VSAIAVRQAVETDAAAIAGIHVRGWRAAYRGLVPDTLLDGLSIERRERGWRGLIAGTRGSSATHVGELDGHVAGFCSVVAPTRDDGAPPWTAEIAALYVEPGRWRGGVGAALLERALADLARDGWRRATLWVLEHNEPAIAFYRRFGFAADGATQDDATLEATEVRMVRALG